MIVFCRRDGNVQEDRARRGDESSCLRFKGDLFFLLLQFIVKNRNYFCIGTLPKYFTLKTTNNICVIESKTGILR